MRSVGIVVSYAASFTPSLQLRPTSVYRRSQLQALDVIQSDSEVGFYDSTT